MAASGPKAPDIQNFCGNKNLIHWMARLINGRRAVSSVQIANDIVLLGKFSEMLIGSWLGVEILVNTYSWATLAETVILATLLVGVGFGYPLAFCASLESGAQ